MLLHHKLSQRVLEGNRPNTAIGKLLATDPDEGDNGRITYEITAHSPSDERINETFQVTDTGILIALKTLDRETTPDGYRFKVTATDHGSPKRLSATTDVRVILDDLNDCTPVFTHNQYNFTIIEDYAQNFTGERMVGTVKATDCDIGENGKVAYTILDPGLPFSITKDGILRTSRLIDRELRSVYRFTVLAQDGGGDHSRPERYGVEKFSYERPGDGSGATRSTTDQKHRTSATQVRITILDLNDNYPLFVYPNSSSLKVHVSVQESREFVVTRLVALDKDSGPNGQVQYRIVRANASHGLQIRRTTGELYVEKDMTNNNKGIIELLIEASDQGSPPQKNSIQLHVSVNNMPPVGRNMILVSRSGFADLEKDTGNQSGTIEINKLIMMCIVISTTVICIIMMFVIGLCVRRTSCYRLRRSLGTPCNRTSAVMWRAENGTKGQSENEKKFSNICKKYAICENIQTTFQPMISRTTSSSPCAMTTESSKLLAEGDAVNTPVDDPIYNGTSEDPTISNNYVDVLRSETGNQERLLAKPGFMRIPSDLVSCHTEQNQRVHEPSHHFHPPTVQLSPVQGVTTSHPLTVSIDRQMEHDRCLVHVDTSTGVGYLAIPMSSSQNQVDAKSSFTRDKYFVRNPSKLMSSSHQPHHLDLHVLESDVDSGRGGSVVNIGPPCSNADTVVPNSVADSHLSNLTTPNNSVQSLSPQCMQQSMIDVPVNYLPGQLSLITVDGQLCVLAPSNVVSQTNAILVTTADIVNDSQDLSQLDLIQASTPVKTVNTALESPCTYSQQVTCESQPRSTSANNLPTVGEHKSTLGSPWRLIDLPP
ncbi:protocadherin-11 X-linked [Clonorchis sinensis]|uniref:Protocadherin-11 X-linked n=2 Tax=Clonorchis sinensis TaxID=79923 RepID=G7Y8U5_CLOSI|nr:protocadherin-11 X-linked [Clonorchis sinensis]